MAFQRTEYLLGPVTESDGINLQLIRFTSVTRELVTNHRMILKLGVYPAFTWGKLLMKATQNQTEPLCST